MEAFEALERNPNAPAARLRETAERLVSLYADWENGPQHQRWESKLTELSASAGAG